MHEPSRGESAVSSGPVAGDAIPAAARVIELRLSQLRRLFDRYDVTSRTALARVAVRQGWIDESR